ncbi:MAG: LPS export ABC transporter permease LptG [Alphaproteobacteria bacterium]|nr:LPS export ABC transporter permease LptG [Alphaproteobacteria bacterium]HCP00312.1 LPS export ABC transporter permease LptG [Rhodospirillaceae bacterium]
MINSRTISLYILRQFLVWFAIMFMTIVAVIVLIDAVELLRRGSGRSEATFSIITSMALLRTPFLAQEAMPFAVMFGGIFTFLRLTRNHELVVLRAAGVSVWQFLTPAIIAAITIGIINISVINPLSAVLLSQFEELEGRYFTGRSSLLAVSTEGIWLRQNSANGDGQTVIHAARVQPDELRLEQVIVFEFSEGDKFIARIDAKAALLQDGRWQLSDAWLTRPGRAGVFVETQDLATDLTPDKIQESFASPDTVALWNLPRFIRVLEETGFSPVAHQLQLHTLLAEPVLLAAMVLIAATFSLRLTRRGGTVLLVGAGVLVSFFLFLLTNVIQALGLGVSVPVLLAAWTPAGVSLLAGITSLLHLEDG